MNQKRLNNQYEIILELLKSPTHGRKLSETLNTPQTTIQRTLNVLEKDNIIKYKTEGKNKIYTLKNTPKAKSYIMIAENYKLLKLLNMYPKLEPLIDDLKSSYNGQIILFGSYAKFISKKESDIDIYIDTKNQKIKTQLEQINSKLSIKTGTFKLGDPLTEEIIKYHVIIKGVEQFYDTITKKA